MRQITFTSSEFQPTGNITYPLSASHCSATLHGMSYVFHFLVVILIYCPGNSCNSTGSLFKISLQEHLKEVFIVVHPPDRGIPVENHQRTSFMIGKYLSIVRRHLFPSMLRDNHQVTKALGHGPTGQPAVHVHGHLHYSRDFHSHQNVPVRYCTDFGRYKACSLWALYDSLCP